MTNHYETLEVEAGASPEDIKKAFRRKARKAHPDAGGSDAAMAEVNKAYAVLADPQRRVQYDQSGDDTDKQSPESEACSVVMQFFNECIEQNIMNPVAYAHKRIKDNQLQLAKIIRDTNDKIARLEKRRDKVSVKEGVNLFHALVDQQLTGLRQALPQYENLIHVGELAQKLLDNHESFEIDTRPSFDQRDPFTQFMFRP